MDPDLRIVEDVAESALDLFLAAGPRTVLLTGGATPEALYRRLAATEYPWADVELFLSDERCVPRDDPRSNGGMIERTLGSRVPAGFYPMDGAACDAEGYEAALRERFGSNLRFDLALYGLGPDGHTASLFPGRPEVEVSDRWVVAVPEAGWEPFVPRLSLTVPALCAATVGLFLVSGESKRDPLSRLLRGEDLPSARMRPERLVILADPAAAG